MVSIAKLSGKLTLDTSGWTGGFAKAENATKKSAANLKTGMGALSSLTAPLSGMFSGLSSTLSSIGTAAMSLGPAGAVAAVGIAAISAAAITGYYSLTQLSKAMDRVGAFDEQSKRLGVSVATIQMLDLTARTTGTSVDTLTRAMYAMSKSVGSGGMSLDKRFIQQAKAIAAIKDPAERAAKAMKVFGKSAIELMPLFSDIGALDEAAETIERFGLAITDVEAGHVEQLGDEFKKLGFLAEGFWNKAIVAIAPAALVLFDQLFGAIERVGVSLSKLGVTWEGVGDVFIAVGAVASVVFASMESGALKAMAAVKAGRGMLTEALADIAAAAEIDRGILSGKVAMDFIRSATDISESAGKAASGINQEADALDKLAAALKNPSLERGSAGAISAVQSLGGMGPKGGPVGKLGAFGAMNEGRFGGGPGGFLPPNPVLPAGGRGLFLNPALPARTGPGGEDAPTETTAMKSLAAMLRIVSHIEGTPGILPAAI